MKSGVAGVIVAVAMRFSSYVAAAHPKALVATAGAHADLCIRRGNRPCPVQRGRLLLRCRCRAANIATA